MAKVVQMVRQTTGQIGNTTGPDGQLIVNTDTHAIHVQDGATPGGHSTAMTNANLSDLTDKAIARENLELGSAAQKDATFFALATDLDAVSTVANNAGIVANDAADAASTAQDTANAAQIAANAAQITATSAQATATTANGNAGTAQTAANNAGVAATAAQTSANTALTNAAAAVVTANNASAIASTALIKTSNLSDLVNPATARTNLGFKIYTSADISFPGSWASIIFNHAFGFFPQMINYFLVCQTAQGGYAINDVIQIVPAGEQTSAGGFGSIVDINNITLYFGSSSTLSYSSKTDGSHTNLSTFAFTVWKIRVKAFGAN